MALLALEDTRKELLQQSGALLYGDFTLSSGNPSSYYFDSKPLTLDPDGEFEVGCYFLEKLLQTDAEAVGGMALGAIPIVSAVTLLSRIHNETHHTRLLPSFYVRKEAKEHGTQNLIEGNMPSDVNAPVAIVDDVVTGGNSILKAIEAVEAKGNPIVAVMCILDRDEGGREMLKIKKNYDLISMYTMKNGELTYNP